MIRKITYGWVSQNWNESTGQWESQEFVAGDQVEYENEMGDSVDPPDNETYLPFDMVQPNSPE